jgi:hypothetical protein
VAGAKSKEASSEVIMTAPVDPSAAGLKFDNGMKLYPSVKTNIGHNNNVNSANVNPVSSNFVSVKPTVVAEMKNRGDRYTVFAAGDSLTYNSSSDDNSTTSDFGVAGDNFFTARARAGWAAGMVNGADPRGSVITTLNLYKMSTVKGRFIYGAKEASGRFEVDVSRQNKEYSNNRATTAALDQSTNAIAGRVFYRVGSNTELLAEVQNAQADYVTALAATNRERKYYLGATWDATAVTKGIVKVGNMTKDFDQGTRPGFNGGSWEAAMEWSPQSNATVALTASRATADSSGTGNYELRTNNGLMWMHNWTQSVSSKVSTGLSTTEFNGAGRTDDARNFGFSVDYALLRWLKIGVDFATTDSTSNVAGSGFKRNITMFTLNASL